MTYLNENLEKEHELAKSIIIINEIKNLAQTIPSVLDYINDKK